MQLPAVKVSERWKEPLTVQHQQQEEMENARRGDHELVSLMGRDEQEE